MPGGMAAWRKIGRAVEVMLRLGIEQHAVTIG